MCGIAGILNFGKAYEPDELRRWAQGMAQCMVHRGPDCDGIWVDPEGLCALSHRRLSIIDTSDAGRQPMESADRRYSIAFNGELYNYLELRPDLESRGHVFRTRTDTETLIEMLRAFGPDAFGKLDGMYAFGCFDRQNRELLLARDPFGEKPLYYLKTPKVLAFASELHALQTLPFFDDAVDADAIAEYLCFQYIDAPRTLYRSVLKLPPGHDLRVQTDGECRLHRHFEFAPGVNEAAPRDLDDLADELEDILLRGIGRRLISDVPLGAFLSGGVDSSTVAALICKRLKQPLKTFSIGFTGSRESEHAAARRFAELLGTDHREKILTPDAGAFLHEIGRLLDEPNGDSSCLPTYLLSEFARQEVTVAISGDGGDEMFGGYGRYFTTLDEEARSRRGELPGWLPGNAYFSSRMLIFEENDIRALFGFVPESLRRVLDERRQELNRNTAIPLLARMRKTDVDHYLPGAVLAKVDRMSMRHSLEVRTPFLSIEIARFVEKLPLNALYADGQGKRVLKQLACRYLPAAMIHVPKRGFGLPTLDAWGRKEFLSTADSLLAADDCRVAQCLGRTAVRRFLDRQQDRGFSTYQVWALAVLESYLREKPASLTRAIPSSVEGSESIIEDAAAFLSLKEYAKPIVAFCRDVVPSWWNALPSGSVLVTSLPVSLAPAPVGSPSADGSGRRGAAGQGCPALPDMGSVLVMQIDRWKEELPDVSVLPPHIPAGAVAYIRSVPFSTWSIRKCRRMLVRQGFRRMICASEEGLVYHDENLPGSLGERFLRQTRSLCIVGAGRPLLAATEGAVSFQTFLRESFRPIDDSIGPYISDGGYSRKGLLPYPTRQRDREAAGDFALFEDGMLMPGVAAPHDDIRERGGGRYSAWNGEVFFSSLDHSCPNADGRSWTILPRKPWNRWLWRNLPDENAFPLRLREAMEQDNRHGASVAPPIPRPGDTVALITGSLQAGGAERQWCYLARELDAKGFRVILLTLDKLTNDKRHYLPLLEGTKVDLRWARDRGAPIDYTRLAEKSPHLSSRLLQSIPSYLRQDVWSLFLHLRKERPVWTACQLDGPNLAGGLAAWLADVPRIVLSLRNLNPLHLPQVYQPWFQDLYRALSHSRRIVLTGNSTAGNRDYAAWLDLPPERIALARNGVNTRALDQVSTAQVQTLRQSLGLTPTTPTIAGIFRLSPEKRPLVFLDVVSRLHAELPELKVLLAGEGPLRADIEKEIERRGLNKTVLLLGRRDDVPVLISASDILLLTSDSEGTPNVLLEAQYLRVPVVATRAGGTPETVVENVTGLLCRPESVDEMVVRCRELLMNRDQRAAMGKAGREFVAGAFSMDAMVAGILKAGTEAASLPS